MKHLKYSLFTAVLILMASLTTPAFAGYWGSDATTCEEECIDQTTDNATIIVEIGFGTTRCGLESQETPVEFSSTVRHDDVNFINDFRNMMNQVYTKLGITNKAANPVLVLEPDMINRWRRVDMANVLLGENKCPWIYVMTHSYAGAYSHQGPNSTTMVYHADNNNSYVGGVQEGWPLDLHYARRFAYHEPVLNNRADSLLWVLNDCPWDSRRTLVNNIVLSGNNWDNVTEADIKAFEARLDYQRFTLDHVARVFRDPYPARLVPWYGAKKLCADGVMVSWDLAFTLARFNTDGAASIRQWISI